jgi:hypothetical protein
MKTYYFFILVLFLTACNPHRADDRTALTVGNIKISAQEYREAYANSIYGAQNTPGSRKQFLESYALKLLILQQAQEMGLDRDPEFLKDVQEFWQQSLVKRMLERKMTQFAPRANVTDNDIKEYFSQNRNTYFQGKTIEQAAPAIKSFLIFKQQNQAIEDWMQALKSKTLIRANKALVGLE